MSRASLAIFVSGHGQQLECGRSFDCDGLEYWRGKKGFGSRGPVSSCGALAGGSQALARLEYPVRLVTAAESQWECSFGSSQQFRRRVVEGYMHLRRPCSEYLARGGNIPGSTLSLRPVLYCNARRYYISVAV